MLPFPCGEPLVPPHTLQGNWTGAPAPAGAAPARPPAGPDPLSVGLEQTCCVSMRSPPRLSPLQLRDCSACFPPPPLHPTPPPLLQMGMWLPFWKVLFPFLVVRFSFAVSCLSSWQDPSQMNRRYLLASLLGVLQSWEFCSWCLGLPLGETRGM